MKKKNLYTWSYWQHISNNILSQLLIEHLLEDRYYIQEYKYEYERVSKQNVFITYYLPCPILSILHVLFKLIFTTTMCSHYCYFLQFTNEDTKDQRGTITC